MPFPTRSDYIERDMEPPVWAGGPRNPDLADPDAPVMRTFVVRGTFWAEVTAWESIEDAKDEWPAHKIEAEIAKVIKAERTRITWDFDDVQLDLKWMTQDESDAIDEVA